MKLIFSSYDDIKNPHYGGGGAYAIHEVAKRLARDHEVVILTGKYKESKDEVVEGVSYKRIGTNIFGPRIAQLVHQLVLPWYVMTQKYDVWLESFTPPFSTAFLPIFTRKPVIGVVHLLGGEHMYQKYRIPFHVIERMGLKVYRNIIVLTEYFKEKIQKINPRAKVFVIPNGLDDKIIHNNIEKKFEHLLYIGRIERNQKGLDLLLSSLAEVKDRLQVPVLIAGGGESPEIEWLENTIKTEGLGHIVKYVGKVHGSQKEEIFQNAALLLVPSRFEAMPLVIIEALGYGIPTICYDIPEFSFLPSELSIKIPKFDTSSYGSEITKLLDNRSQLEKLSIKIKEYSQQYSWDKQAEEYNRSISFI